MSNTIINIIANGGPVTAKISSKISPQVYAGVIWRYKEDETFEQRCGQYQHDQQEVSLGTAAEAANKLFLVEGVLINQNDNPPVAYKMEVSIMQDGNVLKTEVPTDGGSGNISDKDIAFVYHFNLKTQ